jgi:hypothetical protein
MIKKPDVITPEIQKIMDDYEAERNSIQRQHNKELGRMVGGALLQGASALPIFNIPYVGTGVGGALYELGGGIISGNKLPELAKKAGQGFLVGETVGAIPYLGKFAGKTKVGQTVNNKVSQGLSQLAKTPLGQKVTEIAPKVEDVLMTDIKAFNPNKQTGYHGSPADFNKFDNAHIGTGEGAQAHGMGHYAAKNKDVAEEYRRNLSKKDTPYEEYKTLTNYIDFLNGLKEKAGLPEGLENALQKSKTELSNLMNTYKPEEYLNNVNNGQLYKLSIPKDDVMLREGATLAEQPKIVQKALNELYPDYIPNDTPLAGLFTRELFAKQGKDRTKDEIKQAISDKLYSKGVKGISYNGGIDGEARVIFNPDDIEIVRKYYNQPGLAEFAKKYIPNMGAISNSLIVE